MAIPRRVAALVVNSTKADGGTGSLRRTLTAAVAAAGWEPLWLETTSADHGRGAAARALREGASLVLVYGGDGTVREVTGTMAGSGVPLGLLPAGSGNLLARALGVPVTDLGAALRIALHGRDRPIDVARVAGTDPVERFCVMGGVGLDAAMIRDAPERWKALLGWLAYLGAAVRNLGRPTVPMEIRVDDGPPVRTGEVGRRRERRPAALGEQPPPGRPARRRHPRRGDHRRAWDCRLARRGRGRRRPPWPVQGRHRAAGPRDPHHAGHPSTP